MLLLGHEGFCQLVQIDFFILVQVEAFLVAVGVRDHAHLGFHLDDSRIAEIHLLALGFCLLRQPVNSFQQLLLVVALLSNVCLHLLVVRVNLGLDFLVDVLDPLDQLVHEGVHLVAKLRRFLLELGEQFKADSYLLLHTFDLFCNRVGWFV